MDLSSINDLMNGIWAEAATEYAAEWRAKRLAGKRGPVGVQRYLNSVIDHRFTEAGWGAYASTYTRDFLWWRFTFRHQMSAGSNFLEALKAVLRYEYKVAVIAAATREFLEVISPADAPALTSFEKIQAELDDLKGVISAPIVIAALHRCSVPSQPTLDALSDPSRNR